jgi:hypothetical protein
MKRCLLTGLVLACATILLTMPQVGQASRPERTNVRFAPVHVYLDPGGKPLAAYQFELVCSVPVRAYSSTDEEDNASRRHYEPQIKIVGVEGGEHPAFKEAPYYDPAALMNDRIIIAAFNTGSDLPTTRTRIATIHLQITGDAEPKYELKLITAADSSAEEIPAQITLHSGEDK